MKCLPAMTLTLKIFGGIIIAITALWCFGAIWYSNLPAEWMRQMAAVIFAAAMIAGAVMIRSYPKAILSGMLIVILGVIIWWSLIPASNDGDWETPFARMPEITINGDKVTIKNIRDFKYHTETDYTPRYRDDTFNLDQLKTVDLALSYWDGNRAIAHSMLSFGFADGRHVVFSCETRLRKGVPQNAIRGLFKQYNILFIIGTENDLLKLRTNYRGEQLYLYPSVIRPEKLKQLFLSLLTRTDELRKKPRFYNTLTYNCTTSLIPSLPRAREGGFDIRFYLNGYSDEIAFERGSLRVRPGESFKEFRARHLCNQYVKDLKPGDDYSRMIRPTGIF